MSAPLELNERSLSQALIRDRFSLRKSIRQLKRNEDAKLREKTLEKLRASIELVDRRKKSIPETHFDTELPVNQKREEIRKLIEENPVVIVCGETGSGKSTQLPKICLEAGLGVFGTIGHTQPRRIAARSVAARVAQELKCELGKQVGYKVRFHDQTSGESLIKLMTDGILLAETQTDRFLEQYDALIIDEAHERSLNIDFLLGFLKTLLSKRPEFRLIITSATIDADRFSEHFMLDGKPAPIIEVSGRSYPVEIVYRPLEESESKSKGDYFEGINDAVIELLTVEPGDTLVFLPTEKDIRTAAKKLRGLDELRRFPGKIEILPLYGRMSVADQNKIFQPGNERRIVLATNVAESSLTVPRIKYVIDSGLARISRYSPRSKIQRLPIEEISQASANQRAGRCGRLGPGVCVRLYSEEDFESRDEFTTPEIRRTNLASVILQAKSMHFGDVDRIDFLDPPRPESIRDGYKTLFEIGATDTYRKLTQLGQKIKHFPCDPRISRMILAGDEEGSLADVLIIAAALEVQDVRDRPAEKQKQADQAHEKFAHIESDFMTLLNIWDFYHSQKEKLSNSQLKKSLQQNFLSFVRIREWLDVYRQLKDMCHQQKIRVGQRKNEFDNIHRALLAGMLSGIALKGDKYEYEGAGGTKFFLWPGSGLIEQSPRWILGTEVVETSKRYIRNVARIQPGWIEPLAKHLVSKSHSDPFWHEKSEKVMCNEKVSLFGLTIIPRRMVPFANTDPHKARQIFIDEALIGNRLPQRHPFQNSNSLLLENVQTNLNKTRDRDYIVDDAALFSFFDEHVPESVFDGVSLKKWIQQGEDHNATLTLTEADLQSNSNLEEDAFPDQIATSTIDLNLEYAFNPGTKKDGITTTVPKVAISQLNASRLDWLVPGLLSQKIESLIRSLPKSKRRWFAPIPETAKRIAEELDFAKGDLKTALARELTRIAEEPVAGDDFDVTKVEHHLQMNIEIIDEDGKVVDSSRDLLELQEKYCDGVQQVAIPSSDQTWNQTGLKEWSFGDLPESVPVSHGGMELCGYPAIVDEGNSVGIKIFPSRPLAQHETKFGIMRLASLAHSKILRKQVKWLPEIDSWGVIASQFSSSSAFHSDLMDLIARRAFVDLQDRLPTTRAQFDALQSRHVESISIASQDVAQLLPRFFESYQNLKLAIASQNGTGPLLAAIKEQLNNLLADRFWVTTPWNWLIRFPIYFKSICLRLEKLNSKTLPQELEIEKMLKGHYESFLEIKKRHLAQGIHDDELIKFRFMIEELRVSLFSQKLGTALTVSEKRLEKQISKLA